MKKIYHIICSLVVLQAALAEEDASEGTQVTPGNTDVCPYWDYTYPYSSGVDSACWFSVSASTKERFLHEVAQHSYSLVNFALRFENVPRHQINETKCVIQGNKWTWTFPGPKGSRQYLNWPLGYRVWSLGLLDVYALENFSVPLRVNGNCQIQYGANETTQRISLALANLTDYLVSYTKDGDVNDMVENYNQSYWCYRERIFIKSHALYLLCLNVICPLEAMGYRCCRWKWNFLEKTRILECSGTYLKYRKIGWKLPFVLGLVLYMYFPLILVWLLKYVHEITHSGRSNYHELQNFPSSDMESHIRLIGKKESWIFYNPIHIGTIVTSIFKYCCVKCPIWTSRIVRITFFFVSISIIALKVLLHGLMQYNDIVASVKKGVPNDFQSMLAGYELSSKNFLRVFGGPFLACLLYAVCFILSTCVPSDLATFLAKGLVENKNKITSPLKVDAFVRVKFGAMKTTESINGYEKIFRFFLSQFFMVLNPSFWKFAVITQIRRWNKYSLNAWRKSAFIGRIFLFIAPLYVLFSVLELALCLLLYGIPLISFIMTIARAYVIAPWRDLDICVPLKIICCLFAFCFVAFSNYMFSIIFVDSFVFICGVFVYTYTGLFAHPEVTYGYLIFSFTVLMYMFDSLNDISKVYDNIFLHTRKICKKIHKYGQYPDTSLFKREEECKGIPKDLFFLIVKKYRPIRQQIFISLLKLSVIVLILYISVDLLFEFSASKNLSILTQAAATIIVCLVPKVLGDSCSMFKKRRHHSQSQEIKRIIHAYCHPSREVDAPGGPSNLEVL
ncbi:uncharacterized protein LOC133189949 [Saccostrea echinata]|uniref:uncharacterized protein LOC133189949 n=1 Tax=Saccostrea echinata TaxID=191078 RepID=UPI002A825187|nr:uncharacterized protein LOC133189949 [Saccostrea echinata]